MLECFVNRWTSPIEEAGCRKYGLKNESQKSSVGMAQIIPGGKEFYDKIDKPKLVKKSGWEIYHIDETTKEKWIQEYLHGEMHGGGPPQLRLLEKFPWE